jgi:parallel beta-helix repeat protein
LLSARAARFSFACRFAVVATVLLAAAAIPPAAASATVLPTTIGENMTLTAAGSPYTGSSTTISEGVTVTAQPGALVKLTGTLTVKGTLDVNGTAEGPVVFTSSTNTAPGQWTGIALQTGAGGSSLSHAEIRYAKTAIVVSGGISPEIVDSTIRDNSVTGISAVTGSPQITGNSLSDNGKGIVVSGKGSPEIAENTIEDCTGYGISRTLTQIRE